MPLDFLQQHAGELIVGIVLGIFGLSFRSWAQMLGSWKTTVEKSTGRVFDSIESLATDYHNHKVESERRIARLEAKVEQLERRCEDNAHRLEQHRR